MEAEVCVRYRCSRKETGMHVLAQLISELEVTPANGGCRGMRVHYIDSYGR